MPATPLDSLVVETLNDKLAALESALEADVISLHGPIMYGVESRLKQALEAVRERKEKIAIVLHTPGGIVEVVERMVDSIRHFYSDVTFIIPDIAMSAGTVFVMSGDRILMNYFSVLGPIDPQIQKDGKLVPALSYLSQYEKLVKRSSEGQLTTAEFTLLNKLDLGDLDTFIQARQLSIDLLENWLSTYKFKDWTRTETRGAEVTATMRRERAGEIAKSLIDYESWHSHSRGISMKTLRDKFQLKIEDYGATTDISSRIHGYYDIFTDYLVQRGVQSFVHSRYYV